LQRLPALPATNEPRTISCTILDTMLIFITHNMRKKLEVDLYRTALSVVHRLLAYQIKHKSKIGKIMVLYLNQTNKLTESEYCSIVGYHWSHLWQVLLGLLRFLGSHYEQISAEGDVDELLQLVCGSVRQCFSHVVGYLPRNYARLTPGCHDTQPMYRSQ
jgi:hypothetical protein